MWAEDRDEARARMARALDEYVIEGVKTTIPFHRMIMDHPRFAAGEISTSFVESELDLSGLTQPVAGTGAPIAPVAGPGTERIVTVEIGGKRFEVAVSGLGAAPGAATAGARPSPPKAEAKQRDAGPGVKETVRAPMQGTVVKTEVAVGDTVSAGDLLVVLEAMKMENHITAPRDGTVGELPAKPGQNVEAGAALVVLE